MRRPLFIFYVFFVQSFSLTWRFGCYHWCTQKQEKIKTEMKMTININFISVKKKNNMNFSVILYSVLFIRLSFAHLRICLQELNCFHANACVCMLPSHIHSHKNEVASHTLRHSAHNSSAYSFSYYFHYDFHFFCSPLGKCNLFVGVPAAYFDQHYTHKHKHTPTIYIDKSRNAAA